tara:strand:+ start:223 stop:714 length:492 start_codon:yes stop_codon:yes gene_type:complete
MPLLTTGGVGVRNQDGSGTYAVYSTDGGSCAYLPYGGSYYTVLFYNPGGYGRMMGRCDWGLAISQQHMGAFNFEISKYGVNIQNIYNSNSSFASFSAATNVGGNGNYHGITWTNGNGSSWGNGTLCFTVRTWAPFGGVLVSGAFNSNSNYSHGNSNAFLKRII